VSSVQKKIRFKGPNSLTAFKNVNQKTTTAFLSINLLIATLEIQVRIYIHHRFIRIVTFSISKSHPLFQGKSKSERWCVRMSEVRMKLSSLLAEWQSQVARQRAPNNDASFIRTHSRIHRFTVNTIITRLEASRSHFFVMLRFTYVCTGACLYSDVMTPLEGQTWVVWEVADNIPTGIRILKYSYTDTILTCCDIGIPIKS